MAKYWRWLANRQNKCKEVPTLSTLTFSTVSKAVSQCQTHLGIYPDSSRLCMIKMPGVPVGGNFLARGMRPSKELMRTAPRWVESNISAIEYICLQRSHVGVMQEVIYMRTAIASSVMVKPFLVPQDCTSMSWIEFLPLNIYAFNVLMSVWCKRLSTCEELTTFPTLAFSTVSKAVSQCRMHLGFYLDSSRLCVW